MARHNHWIHSKKGFSPDFFLRYAVEEYSNGRASLSALAKKTGLDVPTIIEEVARVTGEDKRVLEVFLSAVKTISEVNETIVAPPN